MTVLPDILLPGAGLSATRSAPASPADTAKTNREAEATRFADVYARERQARPAERSSEPPRREARAGGQARAAEHGQAPEHARRHERVGDSSPAEAGEQADAGESAPLVAGKDGKDLPPEATAEAPESEQDPLALLGLAFTEQPAEPVETTPETVTGEAPVDAEAAAEEASPTTLAPAVLAAVDVAGEEVAQEGELTLEGEPQIASLVQVAGKAKASSAEAGAEPDALELTELDADASQAEVSEQVLTRLAEGGQPGQQSREGSKEAFANRLNGITQALAQHSGSNVSRPAPLVPGQPLALQQPGMSEAVVDRVMWMSSQNLKSAEIQLDPAELGRMEVRIEMNKDQAQVTFLSPHAGVRDALEGQMQRLREMFTQQGLNLADVNVSDQSLARGWQGQGEGQQGRGEGRGRGPAGEDELAVSGSVDIAANRQNGQRGLVDYYA